jgi:Fe-S cluster assembly protein SufD
MTEVDVPAGDSRFMIRHTAEADISHTFHLREPESRVTVVGFVDARGDAAATLTTTIIHHAPQTKAETLIRTLSQDTAAPRFTGLLQITKGNQGCESYLNHHSLLLGTEAKSWTTPSLEILNNEVKCSHAATIRTITPFDLFYLQSRGLPATEAQNLLTEAFLADVQS